MADTAVPVVALVPNVVSGDAVTTGAGGTSVTAGNTAVIAAKGDTSDLVVALTNASGGATATVELGDNPPSMNADLGSLAAQSVPAADLVLLSLAGGQFVQSDGTVRIAIASNTVIVTPFRIPREA